MRFINSNAENSNYSSLQQSTFEKHEHSENPDLSPGRQSILKILKMRGETSLSRLSEILGVSKMAVLKHMSKLEDAGLVQRRAVHKGDLGRPEHTYRLTPEGSELFPKAFSEIAMCALSFIEQTHGRGEVTQMLRKRQKELFEKYNEKIEGAPLAEKVNMLATLRDKDGYMAESRSLGRSSFEILEHNCPIAALAEKYGETCTTEKELFELLLQTEVIVSHRVVAGDPVCRFLIRKKQE